MFRVDIPENVYQCRLCGNRDMSYLMTVGHLCGQHKIYIYTCIQIIYNR